LIAAISLDEGVSDAMTLSGAVDGLAFEAYVQEVLAPKLRPGMIVVLDQLGAHQIPEVKEAIEARGCEVVFLPGYSPDLNPIENAFSKIKAFVRGVGARTREALDEAIAAAVKMVSLVDVLGWFRHAGIPHQSF
jgi:transposase